MTTAVRNRLLAIASLLIAAGALAFIAFGNLEQNIVYYWTPGELLSKGEGAHGATVRLGGVVQPGSIDWDASKTHLRFKVTDDMRPGSPAVLVSSSQMPPQMFREGIGVVVEGSYEKSGTFQSNRLMVNHSNEYRAPKDGQGKEWKETLSEADTGTGSTRK